MSINQNTVVDGSGVLAKEVTVNGITFPANSTPEQRQALVAKSGLQTQWHTDGTVARMNQGDALTGSKAPPPSTTSRTPPSPAQLEAQNSLTRSTNGATDLKELESPRDAQGRFTTQRDGQRVATVEQEQAAAAVDKLTTRYRQLHKDLIADQDPGSKREEKAQELRESYERDVQRALEGRTDFELRIDPPKKRAPAAPAPTAAPTWQQHVQEGAWVPLDRVTLADTHGFTIPQFVKDQRLHVSLFEQLRGAKAAGITQDQLNVVFRHLAANEGWVKA